MPKTTQVAAAQRTGDKRGKNLYLRTPLPKKRSLKKGFCAGPSKSSKEKGKRGDYPRRGTTGFSRV